MGNIAGLFHKIFVVSTYLCYNDCRAIIEDFIKEAGIFDDEKSCCGYFWRAVAGV